MSSLLFFIRKILGAPLRKFKTLSRKKKILVIVALLIVGGIASRSLSGSSKPKYTLVKAEKSDIIEVVSETGSIATNGRTDIYSPSTGRVETVYVKNGDTVIKGQDLFVIKSSATEQEKAAALAAYLTAKNSLDTANAALYSLQATMFTQWDAFKTLAEGDHYENSDGTPKSDQRGLPEFHIAEKEWLAAEANYKKQQSVISQAQAAATSANLTYQATQDATVKANLEGTISNVSVTLGNTVKAYSPTAASSPLATIASMTTTEAVILLSEGDIAKIQEGQDVTIDVNAIDDKTYQGIVRRVDTIGTEVAGVIRYNVYIEVLHPDELLRPGMTVDADIVTNKLTAVLSVPNAAVKPYQSGRAVRVVDPKTTQIQYVPVEIGVKGAEKTQILSGISEGQEIITSLSNEQLRRPGLFGN